MTENEKTAIVGRKKRIVITEEFYRKVKPLCDLLSNQRDKYGSKALFTDAGIKLIAEYTGVTISTSTFERLCKSKDYDDYKAIAKQANLNSCKNKDTAGDMTRELMEIFGVNKDEEQSGSVPEEIEAKTDNLIVRDSVSEIMNTVNFIKGMLFVDGNDYQPEGMSIANKVNCIAAAVGSVKKETVSRLQQIVVYADEVVSFGVILRDISSSIAKQTDLLEKIANDVSKTRNATEELLAEWNGNKKENKEEQTA